MHRTDRICSLIILAAAVFVGIEARRLAIWSAPGVPGPGFLPILLAVGLAIGAVGVFLEGTRATTGNPKWFPDRASILRLVVLLCAIAALVAAIEPLGMLLAVGLFLLVFLGIYLWGQWSAILLIAVGTPICLHFIFEKWLKFSLPQGFLGF
jgi:putative tricarboxylic transport membrane protein